MTLYNAPNLTSGLDDALLDVAGEVPTFIPMFLIFVYLVVLIGGTTNQKRRTGASDVPMWSLLAGIITLIITLILTLLTGIEGDNYMKIILAVVAALTVLSGVWLFMDRGKGEL